MYSVSDRHSLEARRRGQATITGMSKLTDDPRVDPRIKAFMGHWPVARGRDVGSRAEVLERNAAGATGHRYRDLP